MTLMDAIGKDFFLFEGKQYMDADFFGMMSEELATIKARLNVKIFNTQDIIKKRRKLESPEWFSRRKYTLSLQAMMMPYINSLIQQRLKKERPLSDYFMEYASADLEPLVYERILREAEKGYRLATGGA